jgi:hypothetical protein
LDLEGWFGVGDTDAGYWDAALFAEADELDVVFTAY